MCFLRHLPGEAAVETWSEAAPYANLLIGVGLDSSEVGNPPEWFAEAYQLARDAGLHAVAHAGEEGPPAYIIGALDSLGSERIDHGVRSAEDPALVERLVAEQIPLTMCPLSNVKLRVFDRLEDHNLKDLLDRGVQGDDQLRRPGLLRRLRARQLRGDRRSTGSEPRRPHHPGAQLDRGDVPLRSMRRMRSSPTWMLWRAADGHSRSKTVPIAAGASLPKRFRRRGKRSPIWRNQLEYTNSNARIISGNGAIGSTCARPGNTS